MDLMFDRVTPAGNERTIVAQDDEDDDDFDDAEDDGSEGEDDEDEDEDEGERPGWSD